MLSGVISYVLQSYIGKYVENFNSENVSLGVFRGNLSLENLPLKKDALLDILDLPIIVKSGYIGKMTLHIPYTNPRSQPWVFYIDGLFAVSGPIPPVAYDEEKELLKDKERKQKKLDVLEAKWWKTIKSQSDGNGGYGSSWIAYGATLAYNIVQNIQVEIKNVHIRYEDSVTIPDSSFAVGIRIDQLTAQNTNSADSENEERMYKLLDLKGFSIYCDSDVDSFPVIPKLNYQSMLKCKAEMDFLTGQLKTCLDAVSILGPVNLNGIMKRYTSPLPLTCSQTPRIELNLSLNVLAFNLTQRQFQIFVALSDEYQRVDLQLKHRKYRPQVSVKENPRAWWQFAIKEQTRAVSGCSIKETLLRARDCIFYMTSYQNYLLNHESGKSTKEMERREQLERQLSIDILLKLREIAIHKALETWKQKPASVKEAANVPPPQSSWFGAWWSGSSPGAPPLNSEDAVDGSDSLSYSDLSALTLDEDTDTLLKRDQLFAKLSFSLNTASFSLLECKSISKVSPLITVEAQSLTIGLETRPRYHSLQFSVKIGRFCIEDKVSKGSVFPYIITSSQNQCHSDSTTTDIDQIFSGVYELNPRDCTADYRVDVHSAPLQIVYVPHVFRRVKSFFLFGRSAVSVRKSARRQYQFMKERTKANIRDIINRSMKDVADLEDAGSDGGGPLAGGVSSRAPDISSYRLGKRWQVALRISAPLLIFPQMASSKSTPCVVCDFGTLSLKNHAADMKPKAMVESSAKSQLDDSIDEEDEEFVTPPGTPCPFESDESSSNDLKSFAFPPSSEDPGEIDPKSLPSPKSPEDLLYEFYEVSMVNLQILVGTVSQLSALIPLKTSHNKDKSAPNPKSNLFVDDAIRKLSLVKQFSVMMRVKRRIVSSSFFLEKLQNIRLKTNDPASCVDVPAKIIIDANMECFLLQLTDTKLIDVFKCLKNVTSPGPASVKKKEASNTVKSFGETKSDNYSTDTINRRKRTLSKSHADSGSESMNDRRVLEMKFGVGELIIQLEKGETPIAEFKLSDAECRWIRKLKSQELDLCIHSLIVADAISNLGSDYDLLIASHKEICLDSMSGSINISNMYSPRSSNLPSPIYNSGNFSFECQSPSAEKALIQVSYKWVDGFVDDQMNEIQPCQTIDIKFYNLDVIGNQETLMEIISFFHRISPASDYIQSLQQNSSEEDSASQEINPSQTNNVTVYTEARITAERLNLLLIRILSKNLEKTAYKIGTLTLTGAHLDATLGDAELLSLNVEGLQMKDLTLDSTSDTVQSNILNVGFIERSSTSGSKLCEQRALTMTIYRDKRNHQSEPAVTSSSSSVVVEYEICAEIGSVCYLHSPYFLYQWSQCLNEIRDYISHFVQRLGQAATQLAKTVMNQDGTAELHPLNSNILNKSGDSRAEKVALSKQTIRLDINIKTPILVWPRDRASRHFLIGHLGNMILTNKMKDGETCEISEEAVCSNWLLIRFTNCNVYSLELDKKKSYCCSELLHLFRRTDLGSPLMEDTAISLILTKYERPVDLIDTENLTVTADQQHQWEGAVQIKAQIVHPLVLRLSKQIYEQLMYSLDHNLVFNTSDAPQMSKEIEESDCESIIAQNLLEASVAAAPSDSPFHIEFDFVLPVLEIKLLCDSGGGSGSQDLALFSLNSLTLNMTKSTSLVKQFDLRLQSLDLKDLTSLKHEASPKYLIQSNTPREKVKREGSCNPSDTIPNKRRQKYKSQSLPDLDAMNSCYFDSDRSNIQAFSQSLDLLKSKLNPNRLVTPQNTPSTTRKSHQKSRSNRHASLPSRSHFQNGQFFEGSNEMSNDIRDLVHITAKMIDKKSPDFDGVDRFVTMTFNALTCNIDFDTWVLLLDFIGLGAKVHDSDDLERLKQMNEEKSHGQDTCARQVEEFVNSEIQFCVNSFAVVLNNKDYQLACANISNITADITLREGNMQMNGAVGMLQLEDLSPNAYLYPQRLVSSLSINDQSELSGDLLHFNLFKYGLPDPGLHRSNDISLRLRLAPVYYVHTQLFLTEINTFLHNFLNYQDIIGKTQARMAGRTVSDLPQRSARISLDVEAHAPIVLLPFNANSEKILSIDLGYFTMRNQFLLNDQLDSQRAKGSQHFEYIPAFNFNQSDVSGNSTYQSVCSPGPISNIMTQGVYAAVESDNGDDNCLLDCMEIILSDMNFYLATRFDKSQTSSEETAQDKPLVFPSFVICTAKSNAQLLKEKFNLTLQVERNLDADSNHSAPDWRVCGQLSRLSCYLNLIQYGIVKGILSQNLGQDTAPIQRSKVFAHVPEPANQTVLTGRVWKGMSIVLDMSDVNISLINSEVTSIQSVPSDTMNHQDLNHRLDFCRLEFIKSRLSYESFSDNSRVTELSCSQIRLHDTRYCDLCPSQRPNVFSTLLMPTPCVVSSEQRMKNRTSDIQLNVSFYSTNDSEEFVVRVKQMRLIAIFDCLVDVKKFLCFSLPISPPPLRKSFKTNQTHEESGLSSNPSRSDVSNDLPKKSGYKLIVTDTELVVLENASLLDTSAVILKGSLDLSYCATLENRLVCSLNNLELFSCCLTSYEDSALSILDPTDLSFALKSSNKTASRVSYGIADALDNELPTLEVEFTNINLRFSYNDFQLFLAIVASISSTFANMNNGHATMEQCTDGPADNNFESGMDALSLVSDGIYNTVLEQKLSTDESVIDKISKYVTSIENPDSSQCFSENLVELKTNRTSNCTSNISVCVIDDCLDADVPLVEMNLKDIHFVLNLCGSGQSSYKRSSYAEFVLSGDYFNRNLSGWEPFLEPWKCRLQYNEDYTSQRSTYIYTVKSVDILNVDITLPMLDLAKQTKNKWLSSFQQMNRSKSAPENVNLQEADSQMVERPLPTSKTLESIGCKRRQPFIPFYLLNKTGSVLYFRKYSEKEQNSKEDSDYVLLGEENYRASSDGDVSADYSWSCVSPNEQAEIILNAKEEALLNQLHDKRRHDRKSKPLDYRIVVSVDGWKICSPVSIDKLGVFFRPISPDPLSKETLSYDARRKCRSDNRLIFEIVRQGTAQKRVIVRSALTVRNQLNNSMELKMDLVGFQDSLTIFIKSLESYHVPLRFVTARILVKPFDDRFSSVFSNEIISWREVHKSGDVKEIVYRCSTFWKEKEQERFPVEKPYWICVNVQRDKFPAEPSDMPGHTITLRPPLRITNLLPIDLTFFLEDTEIKSRVKPGRDAAVHLVDNSTEIRFGVAVENFERCDTLSIPPYDFDHVVCMRLYDDKKRVLELKVKVLSRMNLSRSITVWASYWLVNRSSLPLIFSQYGSLDLTAGQFEEHELARSLSPLLFSFSEHQEGLLLVIRIGNGYCVSGYAQSSKDLRFPFSTKITIDKIGVDTIKLMVENRDSSKPPLVYNIGVEVRKGKGRYQDTTIVTFKPRYILENQSRCSLDFAQQYQLGDGKSQDVKDFLTASPRCCLAFHWPRQDLDTLLCVRPNKPPASILTSLHGAPSMMGEEALLIKWSGGFKIDGTSSFHIMMRSNYGNYFLHVGVILQGATFYVVFSDVEHLPLPYRIDNFTDVQLIFYQSELHNQIEAKSLIKPNSNIDYVWDEPARKPHLTLQVTGGNTCTYNLNILGPGDPLVYENLVYIVMKSTKDTGVELVLDVIPNSKEIVLNEKVPGRRSQLWKVTQKGEIFHEGSTAPHDPQAPIDVRKMQLLDIDAPAAQPADPKLVKLKLALMNDKRERLQRWKFTEDGCLMNKAKLYVQVKTVNPMVHVLCGPCLLAGKIPTPGVMAFEMQRIRPGSGRLDVDIVNDGPTRVLQIEDASSKRIRQRNEDDWTCYDMPDKQNKSSSVISSMSPISQHVNDVELKVELREGVGVSIINEIPEELIYALFSGIDVHLTRIHARESLEMKIKRIQIDNQLLEASLPILLYTPSPQPSKHGTKSSSSDSQEECSEQVVYATYQRSLQSTWNAFIFNSLVINIRRINIEIEEHLLLKLVQFFQGQQQYANGVSSHLPNDKEDEYQRVYAAAVFNEGKRFYFGLLKVTTSKMILSMETTSSSILSSELKTIKKDLSLNHLTSFVNAPIEMEYFKRENFFDTHHILCQDLMRHYSMTLSDQAYKIFGTTDILGNPFGFFYDISEGVSGLAVDFNVTGLVKHVTHGVTDSTAKVLGNISKVVNNMSMDRDYQTYRSQLIAKANRGSDSSAHFVAGVKNFGYGIVGLTSIFTQPYKDVKDQGLYGLLPGVVKGAVGTMTKPAVGILDLASGAVTSIREAARSSKAGRPNRVREPRCLIPGNLLSTYNRQQAESQAMLSYASARDMEPPQSSGQARYADSDWETVDCASDFVSIDMKKDQPLVDNKERMIKAIVLQNNQTNERVQALVTDRAVRVIRVQKRVTSASADNWRLPPQKELFNIPYTKLKSCRVEPNDKDIYYVKFSKVDGSSAITVRCDYLEIAKELCRNVKEANNNFHERRLTLNI